MVTQARKRRPGAAGEATAAPQAMTAEEYNALPQPGRNKYGAKKVIDDGITFDSKAEHRRYKQLKLMRDAGSITALEVHPRYPLEVNGVLVSRYTPDFRYRERDGTLMVEDVKGGAATKTRAYVMRKKLMKALFDIDVQEVAA